MKIALYLSPAHTVPPTEDRILAPWYLGAHLADGLVGLGHEVTLFAAAGSKTRAKLVSLANGVGARHDAPVQMDWEKNKRAMVDLWEMEQRLAVEMYYRCRKGEFDIVHSHLIVNILPLAALAIEIPTLFTVHNPFSERLVKRLNLYKSQIPNPKHQINPKSQAPNSKLRLQSVRQEGDFGRNIYYLALSKAHRDSAAEYGGGDLPFAGVVYNGVDLEKFRPAVTVSETVSGTRLTSSGNGDEARIGDVKGLRNNSEDVTVTPKRNGHRNRNPNRLTNNITGIVTETAKRNLNKENGHRNRNRITNNEYLLALGRIRPEKGQAEAVTVARRTGLPLIIAGEVVKGDHEGEKYYQEMIRPFIDGRQIRELGVVGRNELVKLYQGALALLMPIHWEEPFGLVMIEAMACGTPVVAFDRGSVGEVVKDGETGYIINPKSEIRNPKQIQNPNDQNSKRFEHLNLENSNLFRASNFEIRISGTEGMVEAVNKLQATSYKLQAKMRENCRKWVEENFTMEKMVEGYEKIYKILRY